MKQVSSLIVAFAIFGAIFGVIPQQAFAEGITTDYVEFNVWVYPDEGESSIDFVTATYEYVTSTGETETILHYTEHVLSTTDDDEIVQYIADKTGLFVDEIKNILSIQVHSTSDCTTTTEGCYEYETDCTTTTEGCYEYETDCTTTTEGCYEDEESYQDYNEFDDLFHLEQRIVELEEENEMLRETISELEEKISQLNTMLMEQVKVIYEWVLSK